MTEVSHQTDIKIHTISKVIKQQKQAHNKLDQFSIRYWKQRLRKAKVKPSYGYYVFQGQLVKDPNEYSVVELITNLWKQGSSLSSIKKELDQRKIKPRKAKDWSYRVIKSIIQRTLENRFNSSESISDSNVTQIKRK